jgi:hypothetical protein
LEQRRHGGILHQSPARCRERIQPGQKFGEPRTVVRRRFSWSPIGCVGWQPPEPEARQKVAGGETTGVEDIAAHDHRAPEGAREAFEGRLAFVPFSRPSRAQWRLGGRWAIGPVVAPPANLFRASGSGGSRLPQRHLIKPHFMGSAERVEILKSDGEAAYGDYDCFLFRMRDRRHAKNRSSRGFFGFG